MSKKNATVNQVKNILLKPLNNISLKNINLNIKIYNKIYYLIYFMNLLIFKLENIIYLIIQYIYQ